jgi:hypothetical protein
MAFRFSLNTKSVYRLPVGTEFSSTKYEQNPKLRNTKIYVLHIWIFCWDSKKWTLNARKTLNWETSNWDSTVLKGFTTFFYILHYRTYPVIFWNTYNLYNRWLCELNHVWSIIGMCKLVYIKLKRKQWHIPKIKVSNSYSNLYLNLFTEWQWENHSCQLVYMYNVWCKLKFFVPLFKW